MSKQKNLINEIGCYEAKTKESEKAGTRCESGPGYPWLEPPVHYQWTTIARQPPILTIPYMYATGDTKCLSCTAIQNVLWRRLELVGVWLSWLNSGFDSSWLLAFLLSYLIRHKFLCFQCEARCWEQNKICYETCNTSTNVPSSDPLNEGLI